MACTREVVAHILIELFLKINKFILDKLLSETRPSDSYVISFILPRLTDIELTCGLF